MDFIVSNILMPLGALGTTLVVGQLLDKEAFKRKFRSRQVQILCAMVFLIKFVMPPLLYSCLSFNYSKDHTYKRLVTHMWLTFY